MRRLALLLTLGSVALAFGSRWLRGERDATAGPSPPSGVPLHGAASADLETPAPLRSAPHEEDLRGARAALVATEEPGSSRGTSSR